jgi:thiol:disulfide interchange protein
MFSRSIQLAFLLALLVTATVAQSPLSWSLESAAKGKSLTAGETLTAELNATLEAGWKLYSTEQPEGGPIATTIKVAEGSPFELAGKVSAPAATNKVDPLFTGFDGKPLVTKFFLSRAKFSIPLRAISDGPASELGVDVRFQICNDTLCHPPKTLRVSFDGVTDAKKPSAAVQTPSEIQAESPPATQVASTQAIPTDIWPFLYLAMSLGALSLLTPCVFPMIPITVSYFTNHSAGSRARSVRLASVYSLGIILTFTIVGMLLAIFVGAAGINLFAANPWVNLLITAIFLFFAFNLFGAYEITVPTGVLTKLDSVTRSREGEGSGIIGALLMGLTFTLTSFTCTSPFVGTILVSASQGDWQMPLIGMLAFSTVFALPFFVLALVPQWIAQLPRAGGWMNSVKVAMGFLEVAAAMKFISNVDLVWKWGIFTRDVVLAVWIAIGVILTVYLLGKFQLSHDSKPERLGAFRMFAAVISLAVSFYLLTGLFGAKLGELESFLPPDLNKSRAAASADEVKWMKDDLPGALQKAKAENKRVFVDFTGYTCTNCRWMEANIFDRPEVEAEMRKFVLVQLYTDGEGEVYERQQSLEQERFGTVALPFYAILDANDQTKATFPGLTRNAGEFVTFLKKGLEN